MLVLLSLIALVIAVLLSAERWYFIALAMLFYLPAAWWKGQLSVVPPMGSDRLSVDVLARLKPGQALDPQSVWNSLSGHWQAVFVANHLFFTKEAIAGCLSSNPADLEHALQAATQYADQNQSEVVELAFVVAGLLQTSPDFHNLMTQHKQQVGDIDAVAHWLGRDAREMHATHKYGGIGRDWAFGFTPLLDRMGHNISRNIMNGGAHFGSLTTSAGVIAVETAFKNRASAVALIGPDGIGKTSSVYALAQRLIEGNSGGGLDYHQVISLNATDIVSRVRQPGELERLMINLTNEAAHAGHVILFLDDASLFFGGGPGSFDGTQILLSIAQAGAVPMILAMTPNDYQRLRGSNPSLATLLTPVVLQEMDEAGVLGVLEDTAVSLEARQRILITYEALHEAYRLSGRYEQDEAYPGKAIKLLQQAVAHADQSVVTALSVQQAVEQSRGVKVATAAPAESDQLLHLEDAIHERMINQTHAVGVVSNALRRARAGVSNPKRPIGSFLFLGPTGVGKTELAKSIAAIYFGNESNMIRLDMSEYQQPDDVQRLLSSDAGSLLIAIRQQPFAVVLLDEIEKAHPNVLNLLLQLLDEGQLTDASGRAASFKDAVIIVTSNAGADTIRSKIEAGESLESFAPQFADELIGSGQFKPELLNRFDELVVFRPLKPEELKQVVSLMVSEINGTLANQNISIELTSAATDKIVEQGNDPRLGARPMRRMLQRAVEDVVAQKILKGEAHPGEHLTLDVGDLAI
jgi:ATP-dependent Clp protease ATP-binding subunit ClpC